MRSKLRKDIPKNELIEAMSMYCTHKYTFNKIAKILGHDRKTLVRHIERDFNLKIKKRYKEKVSITEVIMKSKCEEEKERKKLMEKLKKIAQQYEKNMRVHICELGSKEKKRYDTLGVFKVSRKYKDHMLLIREKDETERKLSVAYRDILTEDMKVTLVG